MFPKNLESGKGPPPASSFSLLDFFDFDRCFFSFFLLLDFDLDPLDSLSSSSLLEDSEDELEELESEDLLECYRSKKIHLLFGYKFLTNKQSSQSAFSLSGMRISLLYTSLILNDFDYHADMILFIQAPVE